MYRIIETFATVILLLLIMMFILHVIRGDAADWLISKFRVDGEDIKLPPSTLPSLPNIPNDPLPPTPPNMG